MLLQQGIDKSKILANLVSPIVYNFISHYNSYETVREILREIYVKPANELFGWHLFAIYLQYQDLFQTPLDNAHLKTHQPNYK